MSLLVLVLDGKVRFTAILKPDYAANYASYTASGRHLLVSSSFKRSSHSSGFLVAGSSFSATISLGGLSQSCRILDVSSTTVGIFRLDSSSGDRGFEIRLYRCLGNLGKRGCEGDGAMRGLDREGFEDVRVYLAVQLHRYAAAVVNHACW